ncbi:MAG: serpin family protein [Bacteroidales bacterium]|nr:serpin family protein [Bacteroidales bacterium]
MKKAVSSFTAMATFLAVMISFSSCEKEPKNDDKTMRTWNCVPIEMTKTQIELVTGGNTFAFDFFRDMVSRAKGSGVLVSPFSLQAAISMLANGAEEETYDEIVDALGWEGYTTEEINSLYRKLTGGLQNVDEEVSLEIANSVWIEKNFPVKESFSSTLKDNYDAEAFNVNFSASSTLGQINGWCSDKTHRMIPKMLDEISPLTRLMLINALYFKGTWMDEFNKKKSENESFYADGKKQKLRFMKDNRPLFGLYSDTFKICEIPYGGGYFTLDVVLPDEGTDFDSFVSSLDDEFWAECRSKMRVYDVDFSFPVFSQDYSSEENIIPFLQSKGVERAFSSEAAQFGKISDNDLLVSRILQKTSFKTDEKGSEAAAVTVVDMRVTSSGPDHEVVVIETPTMTFNADHPFVYIIRESSSGTILFMGAYKG